MVSLYRHFFEITEQVDERNDVEFAMIYPKIMIYGSTCTNRRNIQNNLTKDNL